MMIKVAIIIERIDISLGGAERSVMELTNQLNSLHARVDLIAAKGESQLENVHILCEGEEQSRTPLKKFELAIKEYLRTHEYDIIHSTLPFDFADVYQPRGGSYKEATIRNACSYGNRFVEKFKILSSILNRKRAAMIKAEENVCKASNKTVVAMLSEYVKESFVRHYNLCEERMAVICNGVKIHNNVDKMEVDNLRSIVMRGLNLKEADHPVFYLLAANNLRLKGMAPLLKAFNEVVNKRKQKRAYHLIAGSGNTVKFGLKAKAMGISQNVFFMGALKGIQNALRVCDVAILPTYYDPASRFILEALSTNRPVITTKFNGACDLFEAGRHGLVIESPESVAEMADAIIHFMSGENRKKATKLIIEDNLSEKLSIERHARELMRLYESILEDKVK